MPYSLSWSMGFPHMNDFTYEYSSDNKAFEEKKSIKELPNKQPSAAQPNSCSVEDSRTTAHYVSLFSKFSSMTTYFQWGVLLPSLSIVHLNKVNFSINNKINSLSIHKAFTALVFLQSLLGLATSAQAQVRVEKMPMEAVIYLANENPFLVYVRLDNPRREVVSVVVYGEKNKILFRERVTRHKYNFKLDLSHLPNGEYRVEVANQRKAVTKDIFIETLFQQKTQRIVSLSELSDK